MPPCPPFRAVAYLSAMQYNNEKACQTTSKVTQKNNASSQPLSQFQPIYHEKRECCVTSKVDNNLGKCFQYSRSQPVISPISSLGRPATMEGEI